MFLTGIVFCHRMPAPCGVIGKCREAVLWPACPGLQLQLSPMSLFPDATSISKGMQWHGAVKLESRWPVDTISKIGPPVPKSAVTGGPAGEPPACHDESIQIVMSPAAPHSQLFRCSVQMHESGARKCAACASLLLRRSSTALPHGE